MQTMQSEAAAIEVYIAEKGAPPIRILSKDHPDLTFTLLAKNVLVISDERGPFLILNDWEWRAVKHIYEDTDNANE